VVQAAPLLRRGFSLFYDAVLLIAVLWLAALPLTFIETEFALPHVRPVHQAYFVLVAGVYFISQWVLGGQTLAMKTWRLKLERRDGGALALRDALLRYVTALAGLAAFGLGFLWAFFDRERLFLHDRIARTRIVRG
jgi:uncharacterized RDD family membrane protein YckC